ncbi:MAG: hypothetical protein H7281_14975 [Bacteriovorax sp.]|nr:hypothetical protein [Bacteriovorax sp.]
MNSNNIKNQSSLIANNECTSITTGLPVCGMNGVDYINKEHAECITSVKHIGHCQCSNTLMVCGSDGFDHKECDAIVNQNYSIVKFIPCAAQEM